jgi:hypothetical protein
LARQAHCDSLADTACTAGYHRNPVSQRHSSSSENVPV